MLETRSVISRAKVIGIPLNTTQKTLGGHSPAFILEREANRYPFTAAVCRRTYPSIHPRTDAAKLYAHGEGFTSKAATSSPPDSSPTAVEDDTEEKFNWFKNWWLVQIVDNLETDRPNKIKLLNRDFIVWKGHSGEWIAMDDECPYRMALLSEGRIEDDGNLLCSYHAWRFNESGNCVKIPHAEDDKAHSVACNSPRSAVQTYPCKVCSYSIVSLFELFVCLRFVVLSCGFGPIAVMPLLLSQRSSSFLWMMILQTHSKEMWRRDCHLLISVIYRTATTLYWRISRILRISTLHIMVSPLC